MIPKETEGESFENALARVCRCIGGGMASENKDSDSDLEVITDSVKVDLRCPVSNLILMPVSFAVISLSSVYF